MAAGKHHFSWQIWHLVVMVFLLMNSQKNGHIQGLADDFL
jgi:hypothetical protein